MIRSAPAITLALMATFAIGCDSDSSRPAGPGGDPNFGRGGTPDTDSRTIWEWFTTIGGDTVAGIRGDGYQQDGKSPASGDISGAYEGGKCGVHAKIFWEDPDFSQSGDAIFDSDWERLESCPARKLYFNGIAGPQGPFTNATKIMQIGSTKPNPSYQNMLFDGVTGCSRLKFELTYDSTGKIATNQVLVTRLVASPGQWLVQSQAPHRANCYNTVKGKSQITARYELPFKVKITEVPASPTP